SSRRRHTSCYRDWSSDVCSSDLDRFLHVAARLFEHLAHFARHLLGQRFLALDEEPRRAKEDLAALRRRDQPPRLVSLLRRLDRRSEERRVGEGWRGRLPR